MNKVTFLIFSLCLCITNFCYAQHSPAEYHVNIDLNEVLNDRLKINITVPRVDTDEIIFIMPKIVPGTYEENDFGRFVRELTVRDESGDEIKVKKLGINQWLIKNARGMRSISYWVDDTFEGTGKKVFEPAGTNITSEKNFLINFHGMVGYLDGLTKRPFNVSIQHPENLRPATAAIPLDSSESMDVYRYNDYDQLADTPVMYSPPNSIDFNLNGMEVTLSLYSPNSKHRAIDLKGQVEETIRINKNFLGELNQTRKYAILVYLYDKKFKASSKNVEGALEHRESTVLFMPEYLPANQISETINGVITHEFFHTVLPLKLHSKEIHYFDYLNPQLSQHLWLYEGVTEYLAQLALLEGGALTEDRFLTRITNKKNNSLKFDDALSFTELSKNILSKTNGRQFFNFYMKGALIGMCLDIIIRDQSSGEKGILDLIKILANKYGSDTPFDDGELFNDITSLTYPEVGDFLKNHVEKGQPIPYDDYLHLVGVKHVAPSKRKFVFIDGSVGYDNEQQLFLISEMKTGFGRELGIQIGDYLVSYNGKKITPDNVNDLLVNKISKTREGETVSIIVLRNGQEMEFRANATFQEVPFNGYDFDSLPETDARMAIRNAWLLKN